MPHHVYALIHPTIWKIRYIGLTSKAPRQRLVEHLTKARRTLTAPTATPLYRWINRLADFDLSPTVVLLEITTHRDESEHYWIAHFKSCNARLLNLTEGGDGIQGLAFSEEHRRRIGEARRGIKRSPEICQMLSRIHKGKVLSDETRRKMSEARKGKTQSETTKAKRSITMKGHTYSAERRANISAGKKRAHMLKTQSFATNCP